MPTIAQHHPITSEFWGSYGFGGASANFQAPKHQNIVFDRVTNWRYTKALSFDEMQQVFSESDCLAYNGFSIEEISLHKEELESAGEIRFEIAREGSVALYIHCPEGSDTDTIEQVFRDCSADEINWESDHLLRVWWD